MRTKQCGRIKLANSWVNYLKEMNFKKKLRLLKLLRQKLKKKDRQS
jgi:hypothetical protein